MSGAHSAKRSRASEPHWSRAWAAFVLGAIGVIALSLIAFVLTTQRSPTPRAGPPMLLTEVPSTTKAAPSSSTATSTSAAKRTSAEPTSTHPTSVPATPHTTAAGTTSASVVSRPSRPAHPHQVAPCRSNAPCVVGGSANVPAALASYRRQHGADAVSAVVTAAAQRCAVTGGDGASCGNPFAVAREWRADGSAAIRDIGAGTGNFLLDPAMRSVEVGWAYDPRSRQYMCVLIERT